MDKYIYTYVYICTYTYSRMAADLTLDKNLFLLPFSRVFLNRDIDEFRFLWEFLWELSVDATDVKSVGSGGR